MLLVRLSTLLMAISILVAVALHLKRNRQQLALKAAEEQQAVLRRLNDELAKVLDGLPAIVARVRLHPDGHWERLFRSRNAERVTGWPDADLADRRLYGLCEPPLDRAIHGSASYRILALHGQLTAERQFRRPNGKLRWLRETHNVIARSGDVLDVASLFIDIDAEKTATATAIATGRLATVGELAVSLAHELNQPLTIISMAAENALDALRASARQAAIPHAIERLERIVALVMRTRRVTEHLRLFGRQDDGGREFVELPAVVDGALTLVGGSLDADGISISIDLAPDLPPVRGSQTLLEQVLMNLVINARDALTQHADRDWQRIRLHAWQEREGTVILTVEDSGPGIPSDALQRLFEPFFTTKPPGNGTGLGLPICHGIMSSFGGEIRAGNVAETGGAIFTLILRAQRPPVLQGVADDEPVTVPS